MFGSRSCFHLTGSIKRDVKTNASPEQIREEFVRHRALCGVSLRKARIAQAGFPLVLILHSDRGLIHGVGVVDIVKRRGSWRVVPAGPPLACDWATKCNAADTVGTHSLVDRRQSSKRGCGYIPAAQAVRDNECAPIRDRIVCALLQPARIYESSPNHVLADHDEGRSPDHSEPLEGPIGRLRENIRDPRCSEEPEDREAAPHQTEGNHKRVFGMEDDARIRPSRPLNRLSGKKLWRKYFKRYRRSHRHLILPENRAWTRIFDGGDDTSY